MAEAGKGGGRTRLRNEKTAAEVHWESSEIPDFAAECRIVTGKRPELMTRAIESGSTARVS
jgi:hypothetical protein